MPIACYCLRIRSHILAPGLVQPPIAPRCLILGPSGSSKTTFLYRLKNNEYLPTVPTDGVNSTLFQPLRNTTLTQAVEELEVTRKTSLVFSDIGGSDRREVRLHFLNSVPIQDLSILYFVDASAPIDTLPGVLQELVYHVTYARNRAGGTKYVGIVLNKQDLIGPRDRAYMVQELKTEVDKVMAMIMKEPLLEKKNDTMMWEVLDGGKLGISAKTGEGVKEVFNTVAKAVFGVEEKHQPKLLETVKHGHMGGHGGLLGAVTGHSAAVA
jgi:GTPase SAR1 family protein